jgi:coenzyme PQQ precursor peptide PqqA
MRLPPARCDPAMKIDLIGNSEVPYTGFASKNIRRGESQMKWSKPKVKEVCVALEINDYFPAEYQA